MPEPALSANAERKRRAREVERRRQAVAMLQLGECGCRYAGVQLSNGISPPEARDLAVELAAELSMVAAGLRRLTRLSAPERRSLARQLHAVGMTQKEISDRLGVSPRSVWKYLQPARREPIQRR